MCSHLFPLCYFFQVRPNIIKEFRPIYNLSIFGDFYANVKNARDQIFELEIIHKGREDSFQKYFLIKIM